MPELVKERFPLGWTPSDDAFNGREDGLLRMDNCHLDEIGIVKLFRGFSQESTGPFGNVNSIYSKTFNLNAIIGAGYPNDAKVRYVYDSTSGNLLRNYGSANKDERVFEIGIFSGAGTRECAFTTAFGHIFCFAGEEQWKDRGDVHYPVGFQSGGPPTLTVLAQPSCKTDNKDGSGFYSRWDNAPVEGTSYNKALDYVEVYTSSTSFRGIVQAGKDTAMDKDFTDFGSGVNKDTPGDIFRWNVRIADTSKILKIRLEFLLDAPTLDGLADYTEDIKDYFWMEWEVNSQSTIQVPIENPNQYEYSDDPDFRQYVETVYVPQTVLTPVLRLGNYAWTPLQANRGFFNRVGSDPSKGWSHVKGIRVSFICTDIINCVFNDMEFLGGKDVLNGTYKYIQVDVRNTGYYNATGLSSPESAEIYVNNSKVSIQPATVAAQANECWIFRSSRSVGGFYLVRIIAGTEGFTPGAFTDDIDDIKALRQNTPLGGLQLEEYRTKLPPDIIDAVTISDRILYLTYSSLIPSFKNDADSYDRRFIYELAARNGEVCFFLAKVSEGECIIGTSTDLYSVKGTFNVIDLGGGVTTLDVSIVPLGVKKPPVSRAFTVDDATLYYLAEDGWRINVGSTNKPIIDQLGLLYRNQTRYGIPPVGVNFNNNNVISCTISKGRLLVCMAHKDIDRAMHVYNFSLGYWTFYRSGFDDAICLFTEDDGKVLMAGLGSGTNYLRGWDQEEGTILSYEILTHFFTLSGSDKRNDIKNFYIILDTNETIATVRVRYTNAVNAVITIPFTVSCNGRTVITLDPTLFDKGIAYQVNVSGASDRFAFYGFGINYQPRPALVHRVVVPSNNLGDPHRKRVPTWPVRLDTFGNPVDMVPRVDGVDKPVLSLTSAEERTLNYYFTEDTTGVDFGYTLSSPNLFEAFEFMPPWVSEVFPMKAKYLQVTPSDLGKASRKRVPTIAFNLNTFSGSTLVTPRLDEVNSPVLAVNTNEFLDTDYYFTSDSVLTHLGFKLVSNTPFEFKGFEPYVIEVLPVRAKCIVQDEHDFGKPTRKDVNTIPVKVNSLGSPVNLIPRIDGTVQVGQTFTSNGPSLVKYFYGSEKSGVLHGLEVSAVNAFELYPPLEPNFTQVHPQQAKYLKVPQNDLGSPTRKKVNTWPIKVNGANVTINPRIDGINKMPSTISSTEPTVLNHYFSGDENGVNMGYSLSSLTPFEPWPPISPNITEVFPQKAIYHRVEEHNWGEPSRKDFTKWPFRIHTFNGVVNVTPSTDGTDLAAQGINTENIWSTESYYATSYSSGIDFGIVFSGPVPFELDKFGVGKSGVPEFSKIYPSDKKFLRVDSSNFQWDSKKRVRTWPFRINTFNGTVIFDPALDCVDQPDSSHNSGDCLRTMYHYFETDVNIVDLEADLSSSVPFELETIRPPVVVEMWPVPKKFDQIGPIEVYKVGILKRIKIRLIPRSSTVDWTLYDRDTIILTGIFEVVPDLHAYYDVDFELDSVDDLQVLRFEFRCTEPFYRTGAWFQVIQSGKESTYSYVEDEGTKR